MIIKDFEKKIEAQQKVCVEVLDKKGKEYAQDEDRLASFRRPTAILGSNAFEIWRGFWSKGIMALYAGARIGDVNEELILDGINYLYLLKSLLIHSNGQPVSHEMLMKEVNDQFATCKDILVEKAKRYCPEGTEDRLGMFKQKAVFEMITPELALAEMMVKHTDSIVKGIANKETKMDFWNEKITDHINYLFLLSALIADKNSAITDKFGTVEKKETKKKEKAAEPKEDVVAEIDPGQVALPFDTDGDGLTEVL